MATLEEVMRIFEKLSKEQQDYCIAFSERLLAEQQAQEAAEKGD